MEKDRSRKARLSMEISIFHIPPSGDVLILGKRCPIGPQAAKKMLDTVSPGEFELVQLEDDRIDGILARKHLFLKAEKERLIEAIIEESKPIMSDQCMMTIKCDITVTIQREI